jgi:hypothetical protein
MCCYPYKKKRAAYVFLRWGIDDIFKSGEDLENPWWEKFPIAVADGVHEVKEKPVKVKHPHGCTS